MRKSLRVTRSREIVSDAEGTSIPLPSLSDRYRCFPCSFVPFFSFRLSVLRNSPSREYTIPADAAAISASVNRCGLRPRCIVKQIMSFFTSRKHELPRRENVTRYEVRTYVATEKKKHIFSLGRRYFRRAAEILACGNQIKRSCNRCPRRTRLSTYALIESLVSNRLIAHGSQLAFRCAPDVCSRFKARIFIFPRFTQVNTRVYVSRIIGAIDNRWKMRRIQAILRYPRPRQNSFPTQRKRFL